MAETKATSNSIKGRGGRLTFWRRLGLGAGEIPGTGSKTIISILFMFFLTDVVGISPAIAGTIFLIGRVWDAVTDPMVGMLSDRTRTKWGRRRPFFLGAAVPLGLFFFLLFVPYPIESMGGKSVIYTIFYLLYMTAITSYMVPYVSVIAESTDVYEERTTINNFRMFFSLVFGLMAATLPKMLADSYADPRQGYMMAGLTVGIVIGIVPLLTFFTAKERFVDRAKQDKFHFFSELFLAFKNKAFRLLLLIYVGSFAAINVIEGFILYYMKYWLRREPDMPIVFVATVLASVITLPLWSVLSKRIGKKATMILGLLFWTVTQFLWLLLSPGDADYWVYIVGALTGFGYGCAHVVPWAMFPDVIDMDEIRTGQRREGVYSGVMTFFMKVGNSIAMFVIGIILEAVGYVPDVEQTGIALQAMRFTMMGGPLIFILLGLIPCFFFPITLSKYKEIRDMLDKRRAEGEPLTETPHHKEVVSEMPVKPEDAKDLKEEE